MVRGKLYKYKDVPQSYVSHFANPTQQSVFKRWINKIYTRKIIYWKDPEKARKQRRDSHKRNPEAARERTRLWRLTERGKTILKRNSEAGIAERAEKRAKILAYKNSPKGIAEALKREKENKERRRKADMIRYYENPTKHSLKRLLLHSVQACIDGKPYKNSNDIINYVQCMAHLDIEAKKLGFNNIADIKKANYHIDHIIPIVAYDCNNIDELKKCFHYKNLRWLPASKNLSKCGRIKSEDIDVIKAIPQHLWPKGFELKETLWF